MPATETGETLGRSTFRTRPRSPKNPQQPSEEHCFEVTLQSIISTINIGLCPLVDIYSYSSEVHKSRKENYFLFSLQPHSTLKTCFGKPGKPFRLIFWQVLGLWRDSAAVWKRKICEVYKHYIGFSSL